jgi:hypothetical protein
MSDAAAIAAFAAIESIRSGDWDAYRERLRRALTARQRELEDPDHVPAKTAEMLASGHQVWAWMQGPGKPHWEIRGTGALIYPQKEES